MKRVGLVIVEERRIDLLKVLARRASVELDLPYQPGDGQPELERASKAAIVSGPVAGWVGWTPTRELPELTKELNSLGAAVVPLASPRGVEPPTLLVGSGKARMSRTLVDTYGTVPYADVDPSRIAGVIYVFMFGMMFGDVGHGAILVLAGLLLRSKHFKKLAKLTKMWPFVVGAGFTSMIFGALYGEAFGPTGLVPTLWLNPMTNPTRLLMIAVFFGVALLGGSYVIGSINRVREGGWAYALYANTGLAGSMLFLGLALLVWAIVSGRAVLLVIATILISIALILIFIGFFVDAGGGPTGAFQAVIELVDSVIGLGSNVVSFARLAAFGMTHAALLSVVWNGTKGLWAPNWHAVLAILLFIVGNVLTFALEALVAGIQALRLEYYELFSRIFQSEGRPFHPWSPVLTPETQPDNPSERHQP